MTNTILSTLSSSIDFIQLKLSDFGSEKLDFEEIIKDRFLGVDKPQNINQKFELLENNHIAYLNPTCPHCNSHNIIKQEYRDRTLILENQPNITVYLRRYLCKSCNKKFITSLDSIIKPGHRYPTTYMNKIIELFQTGYRSLRNASEDIHNFVGVKISHQTIHNWLQITDTNTITNINDDYSGYYAYDEEYVKIKGIWMYRLTLFDTKLNIPVNEKLTLDKDYKTIKHFIIESTKNIPLIAITTDHAREYKKIIDELNVTHQLCIFHLHKMIGDRIFPLLRSKKINNDDKIKLNKYYKEIIEIFNTTNHNTAENRLYKILYKYDNIPRYLRRFIRHKIVPDFERLTQFMHNPKITHTTNQVENYYRQTLPKAIKRKYKTITGLSNYLHLKMQKWTQKHRKTT